MPRQQWSLHNGRPAIEIVLTVQPSGLKEVRRLLADSGAGSERSGFELILDEHDCLLAGGSPCQPTVLGGAYVGTFPIYLMQVNIQSLGFNHHVRAVGVSQPPSGFDGIACFRFLNRFNYGNFGSAAHFGLEL